MPTVPLESTAGITSDALFCDDTSRTSTFRTVAYCTDSLPVADNMPSFYLIYPALAQRIEFLRHLSTQFCAPTCVIGDHGSGKSALLTYLRQNLPEHNAIVIAMEAAAGIKHKQFLARLGKELEPHCRNQAIKSPQQVQKNLIHLSTQGGGLYLLFDDVDRLPPTVIEFLFRCFVKAKNQGGRLGMFFFCGPVMKQRLERSKAGAIKSLPAQFVHIPRLSRDDVAEFLKMWAHVNGVAPESLVDDRTLDAVYRESGALPGIIHEYLPHVLDRAKPNKPSIMAPLSIRSRFPLLAAAGLAAAAGGALLASVVHKSFRTENPPPDDISTSLLEGAAPVIENIPVVSEAPSQSFSKPDLNTSSSVQDKSVPETVPKEKNSDLVEAPPVTQPLKGEDWLRAQTPKNYTIQLMATSHEKNLLEVAHHYIDLKPLAYIRSVRQGKVWFILIVGTYASYAEASRTLLRLPEELQQSEPWIRSVGSVQRIIAPRDD